METPPALAERDRRGLLLGGAAATCVAVPMWLGPTAGVWASLVAIGLALVVRLTRPTTDSQPNSVVAWPFALVCLVPLAQLAPVFQAPSGLEAALESVGAQFAGFGSLQPLETAGWFAAWAGCCGLFFLGRIAGRGASGYWVCAGVLLCSAAVQGLLGINQYWSGLYVQSVEPVAHGTFSHRGLYAACLGAALWQAIGGVRATLRNLDGNRWPVAFLAFAGALCAAGLFLSFSRAALLTAVLLGVGASVLTRSTLLPVGLAAGGLLAASAWGAHSLGVWQTRLGRLFAEGGDPGRWTIWNDGVATLAQHGPLGAGLGAFGSAYRRGGYDFVRKSVSHAHNDYLEWSVELGWPALLLTIALAATVWRVGRAALKLDEPGRTRSLAALLGAAALLLHGLADSVLHSPTPIALAALLLGLAAAGCPLSGCGRSGPLGWMGIAVLGGGLMVGTLLIGGALRPLDCERAARQARAAQLSGRPGAARTDYVRALEVCPAAAPNWLALAELERNEGRLDEALRLTRVAAIVEPRTYRVEWVLADLELANGYTDRALERLADLLRASPDLRPAALRLAWAAAVPLGRIEARLAEPEGRAVGEYLSFLVDTGNADRVEAAYRRLALDRGVELPPSYLRYLAEYGVSRSLGRR